MKFVTCTIYDMYIYIFKALVIGFQVVMPCLSEMEP